MSQTIILDSRGRPITSTDQALDVNIKSGITLSVETGNLATSAKQDEQTAALTGINANLAAILVQGASSTNTLAELLSSDTSVTELQLIRRLLESQQITTESIDRAGVH